MKLLLDNNLSYRLISELQEAYPDSTHVARVGLGDHPDRAIWSYAKDHGFIIVSKDGDFAAMAKLFGPPPPVIWLRFGNCTTDRACRALRGSVVELEALIAQGIAMVEMYEGREYRATR